VKEVFILCAKWELVITFTCFLISELCPEFATRLFTNDDELVRLATRGLRIMNCGFALVGFGMVSSNFFQCLGMVKKSIFLSLSRQLLFLLPFIYFLPVLFESNGMFKPEIGVWISFPISDTLNVVVSAIMIARLFKKFNRLQDGASADVLGSAIK